MKLVINNKQVFFRKQRATTTYVVHRDNCTNTREQKHHARFAADTVCLRDS